MVLKEEEYKALEDIVGPENISDDPLIKATYAFQWLAELINPERKRFTPYEPEAIILPGTTEEVQAIVKVCNRYKIKFKPIGSGWGVWNAPLSERTILLDLRRMNRILEINEERLYAIIETGVISAELQAEAMKRGLSCYLIGAGASCSQLAATIGLAGTSPMGIWMGYGPQNLLAAEWVMPNGELVRTGSLGSGCGWFCGEGPGPSTRGILRGLIGATGCFGVVTKIGLKLYPWPGPSKLSVKGTIPAYIAEVPENCEAHTLAFPSEQAMADCAYRIYDAKIGYVVHRQFNFFGGDLQAAIIKINTDPEKSLDHIEELLKDPDVRRLTEELRHSFQIVLVGNSKGDLEWQEKALRQILDETGGWIVKAMEEPTMKGFTFLWLVRLHAKNQNFLYNGGYVGIAAPPGSPDSITKVVEISVKAKRKFIEEGKLLDDGGNANMGTYGHVGGGGNMYYENFIFPVPAEPEQIEAGLELSKITETELKEAGYFAKPVSIAITPGKENRAARLKMSTHPDIYRFQNKFKRIFDPNDVGAEGYLTIEE